jgi:hypothetical protein
MDPRSRARSDAWLQAACQDADRRGLPELKPLLETLARSSIALREADRAVRDAGLVPGTLDPEDPAHPVPSHSDTTE